MPRTTTPADIIRKARIRADLTYSQHTNDQEALVLLNEAYLDLYVLLTSCDETLFVLQDTLTLSNNSTSIPSDVYKLVSVYIETAGTITNLERIAIKDRIENNSLGYLGNPRYYLQDQTIKVEGVGGTELKILYVPNPTELTGLQDSISLIANEDSYLIAALWRDMAIREETDTKQADIALAMAVSKIKKHLTPRSRDNTSVVDVYDKRPRSMTWRGGR